MSVEAKEIIMETAEKLGWLAEREKKKAREIARDLKQNNVPIDIIAKSTKLSPAEIEGA